MGWGASVQRLLNPAFIQPPIVPAIRHASPAPLPVCACVCVCVRGCVGVCPRRAKNSKNKDAKAKGTLVQVRPGVRGGGGGGEGGGTGRCAVLPRGPPCSWRVASVAVSGAPVRPCRGGPARPCRGAVSRAPGLHPEGATLLARTARVAKAAQQWHGHRGALSRVCPGGGARFKAARHDRQPGVTCWCSGLHLVWCRHFSTPPPTTHIYAHTHFPSLSGGSSTPGTGGWPAGRRGRPHEHL
jgi:hypothetical protein